MFTPCKDSTRIRVFTLITYLFIIFLHGSSVYASSQNKTKQNNLQKCLSNSSLTQKRQTETSNNKEFFFEESESESQEKRDDIKHHHLSIHSKYKNKKIKESLSFLFLTKKSSFDGRLSYHTKQFHQISLARAPPR